MRRGGEGRRRDWGMWTEMNEGEEEEVGDEDEVDDEEGEGSEGGSRWSEGLREPWRGRVWQGGRGGRRPGHCCRPAPALAPP